MPLKPSTAAIIATARKVIAQEVMWSRVCRWGQQRIDRIRLICHRYIGRRRFSRRTSGNAAHALHNLATAEASFRQATVDHPNAAAAFNNLAQVLAERGNLDEALPAAERAVSLGGPLLVPTQATLAESAARPGRDNRNGRRMGATAHAANTQVMVVS
jgi:tetratricopeptide (TPR) repeat protein